ncbi:hypothetical protein COY52_00940 [Candidatus Desantisbacteria bacterium CG_4_10_14_0_8_um_filter_48_22]|uniref:Prepilin-type N-terminal cleavage/methylation domain-containing protein n=1 Tax=Candidatus Desantisbacteria bacterium CG_4_10_14_0_8_um_filter_48_22 TaxID=1974543 RepID=A0A2M7SF47_9BACT|nr:MAG: hypothetical protein AUJ67_03330 [Candidatus Desantisbacteria bacterium CG1_02_49_89]PIV56699.1 MAG: hypothetical protein COS16_03155 [Candidatus Desantisbacteria bacterium CG02_land_8_20_14_3_00_49_13]PIZ18157.1 MAG: hypothetical protein COY52_00940 [Candidatus Desantisbacteria bacterium CG_4_10_14_0_8_um_filter_48_22]PJB27628.1 MAG: hypothetical protein CO111_04310 [Candidatus Desantisbacteria bacterium CG_4_9_14_3_um_filter_50_7]
MKTADIKGYTLIEVLVVFGIIALLILIAVPNFFSMREKSRAQACSRTLRQIEMSVEQYAMDSNKNKGDILSAEELVPTYIKRTPRCPSGGTYQNEGCTAGMLVIGETPTCSIGTNNPIIEWDDHILR